MSKGLYFFVQILFSFLSSTIAWIFLKSGSIKLDFAGMSDSLKAMLPYIIAGGVYLICLIIWIIIGREAVKKWNSGVIIGAIIVAVVFAAAGYFASSYAVDILTTSLGFNPFTV